ncbi:Methyltransferase trt5 [Lachnellula suecica]|uniref:Methyltransferase trt5 n=1 Tax=Lachnellula suecica TaxID=602035 RepID=A0A8T9CIZ9_9HELO|nr:Methyltransferase trt5 [Lachnellula suecica]
MTSNLYSVDPYTLSRDAAASARLNAQHYIWKDQFGYLLHPSIPQRSGALAIADVGTGTGIWILDLARDLPTSTTLDGFDISLTQCPPKGWVPSNVRFRELNIFQDIPMDLLETYDIINVRYMVLVVKSNDPVPILKNLLKLLKPGGYLQWSELNLHSRKLVKSDPQNSTESLIQLQREIGKLSAQTQPSSWPAHLDIYFRAEGMLKVLNNGEWTPNTHLTVAQANTLAVQQDMIGQVKGEKAEFLGDLFMKAVAEYRAGVAWNIERYVAREKAWQIRPYPCVGSFSFLDFTLREFPIYASLIHRLKTENATFVDLGCCFGQNLRWLASDGIPTESMTAVDLLADFWELSFDLFNDKESMNANFIICDILEEQPTNAAKELERSVDVLFAGHFFHLFDWHDQVKAVTRVIRWSKGVGSIVCGEMIGMVEAMAKVSGWGKSGTNHFWQDEHSWRRLWKEAGESTRTNWVLWVEVVKTSDLGECFQWMGDSTTQIRFVCTRIM